MHPQAKDFGYLQRQGWRLFSLHGYVYWDPLTRALTRSSVIQLPNNRICKRLNYEIYINSTKEHMHMPHPVSSPCSKSELKDDLCPLSVFLLGVPARRS